MIEAWGSVLTSSSLAGVIWDLDSFNFCHETFVRRSGLPTQPSGQASAIKEQEAHDHFHARDILPIIGRSSNSNRDVPFDTQLKTARI